MLSENNQLVRLEAAYALALRNGPRTAEAIERVGPLKGTGSNSRIAL
ncbi:hypothetical protein ACWD5R_29010 [Streptomyces sp. NPDC002514]